MPASSAPQRWHFSGAGLPDHPLPMNLGAADVSPLLNPRVLPASCRQTNRRKNCRQDAGSTFDCRLTDSRFEVTMRMQKRMEALLEPALRPRRSRIRLRPAGLDWRTALTTKANPE